MASSGVPSLCVLGVLGPLVVAVSSCGVDEHPEGWAGSPRLGPGSRGGERCEPGSTRECHVTLSEREGVLTCLTGKAQCNAGVWGPCEGAALSTKRRTAFRGGLSEQAIGAPSECAPENPCDPSCLEYDEVPLEPLEADSTGGGFGGEADWQWGSLSDFPGGLVKKALKQPCSSAFECQFAMYCLNPDKGSCSHALCETGAALEYDCDDTFGNAPSCTGMICDIDPSCCEAPAACAHDPCVTGTKLKATCDPCVAQICAEDSTCCTSAWSAACVAKVATTCGNTCSCDTGAGEVLYGGRCFARENDLDRWEDQEDDCVARGVGWHLAELDADENDWLYSSSGWAGDDLWIGVRSQKSGPNWYWKTASGNNFPSDPTFPEWDSGYGTASNNRGAYLCAGGNGKWRDAPITNAKKAVCEGPPPRWRGPHPSRTRGRAPASRWWRASAARCARRARARAASALPGARGRPTRAATATAPPGTRTSISR